MNYKIVVDAGHGGVDPGAVFGDLQEKDFTLEAARYMANRFNELGVPVKLTRDADETLPKAERIKRILNAFGNRNDVILISNHINAGGGEVSNYELLCKKIYYCFLMFSFSAIGIMNSIVLVFKCINV